LNNVEKMHWQRKNYPEYRGGLELNEKTFSDRIREKRHAQSALDRFELRGKETDERIIKYQREYRCDQKGNERNNRTISQFTDVIEDTHFFFGIGVYSCHVQRSTYAFLLSSEEESLFFSSSLLREPSLVPLSNSFFACPRERANLGIALAPKSTNITSAIISSSFVPIMITPPTVHNAVVLVYAIAPIPTRTYKFLLNDL
jgi:hypothetical protein